MTRKHFKAIAAAVAACQRFGGGEDGEYFVTLDESEVIARLAGALAEFNPNFDQARFEEACSV